MKLVDNGNPVSECLAKPIPKNCDQQRPSRPYTGWLGRCFWCRVVVGRMPIGFFPFGVCIGVSQRREWWVCPFAIAWASGMRTTVAKGKLFNATLLAVGVSFGFLLSLVVGEATSQDAAKSAGQARRRAA
ncbi:MAG: hypothetical protein CM1200mP2_01990 [Planctomycetaceae bacterium]|nr:MAG: hypothetical protein CM1200mP2_01990 [Planctomycetaceae bacterium]